MSMTSNHAKEARTFKKGYVTVARRANIVINCSQVPSIMRMAFLNAKQAAVVSQLWIASMEGSSPVRSYSKMASCAAEVIKARSVSK